MTPLLSFSPAQCSLIHLISVISSVQSTSLLSSFSSSFSLQTSSSNTVSIGFSINVAWLPTVTIEEPMSHIMVEIGLAKNVNGIATIMRPVYNCDELNRPNGNTKSLPPNRLIPNTPPATRRITNIKRKFVTRA